MSDVHARISDKWSILTIAMPSRRTTRVSKLELSLGSISQKVLTPMLRGLESDDHILRNCQCNHPA
ncbi:winged helix-turn-helix transcriptional regulator [Paraburkholderia bannensis]|uniref:winged helix-turn-helix transcriptional regulator n=1 Tax=Paraburkholderia bannensis TaxID=765414 RepID=UPI00163E1E33